MPIAGNKSSALFEIALLSMLLLLGFFGTNVGATIEFAEAYSFGEVALARALFQGSDGRYILAGQTQVSTSSPATSNTVAVTVVIVIPEFPSVATLSLFLGFALLAAMMVARAKKKTGAQESNDSYRGRQN